MLQTALIAVCRVQSEITPSPHSRKREDISFCAHLIDMKIIRVASQAPVMTPEDSHR